MYFPDDLWRWQENSTKLGLEDMFQGDSSAHVMQVESLGAQTRERGPHWRGRKFTTGLDEGKNQN
jgi:hypothetical protein